MGKMGMTQRCFLDKCINDSYYTFFVDIYAIKSPRDFIYFLSWMRPSSMPKPSAINPYTGRNRIQGHLLPASTAAAISPCRY